MINIADYKGFYIQKGEIDIVESNATWNILVKKCPFKIVPDIKDLPFNEWQDVSGKDVYIPKKPVYKSYDQKMDFVYIGNLNTANENITAFWSYIQGVEFKFYEAYTRIGRQKVRFKTFDPSSMRRRNKDWVQFSMIFEVNDPVTNIILQP